MQTDPTVTPREVGAQSGGPRAGSGGWGELFVGRNLVYTIALAGGVALHAVNMLVVTTVMPSVVADIGGLDFYAWATTLFVVASILAAALTAKLLKAFGPRGAYCVAALVFTTGTLVASLAPDMSIMLLGRAIQGLGGGFLYALAYAVTRLVFVEALWSRVVGLISAVFGMTTLVGPALGGVFAQYGIWRGAFWSLLPFALAFVALAFVSLPKKSWDNNERTPVAYLQLVLLTVAVLAISAGSLSPSLAWNLAGLAAAIILIIVIARVERSASARLLPSGSFSLAAPLGAIYLTITLLMVSMQPEVFVPYLLQTLHGQSPLTAGYLTALLSIGWTVATLLSARLRERRGELLLFGGPIVVLAGLVLFGLFMPVHGAGSWVLLLPISAALLAMGGGIGLIWPSLVTLVYRSAPETEQDLASGGMTTVQLFAFALGTALAGMVANIAGVVDPGGLAGAQSAARWLAILFALPPLASIVLARRLMRLTGGGR